MQVKLLTSIAGLNFAAHYGDTAELPDNDARRLIARGLAEPLTETAQGPGGREVAAQRVRKPRRIIGKVMA